MGFQQIAHNDDCRARIRGLLDEEKKKEAEKAKRQREEDSLVERRLKAREDQPAEGGGGAASSSSRPASSPMPAVGGRLDQDMPGGAEKRKAGEDGVQDVEDLAREAEESSTLPTESARAMEEVLAASKR